MFDFNTVMLGLSTLLVPVGVASLMRGAPSPSRGKLGEVLVEEPLLRRTGDVLIIMLGVSACCRLAYRFGLIGDGWLGLADVGNYVVAIVVFLYLALWVRSIFRYRARASRTP